MAIEQEVDGPKILPGPLVHGEKTVVSIFSTAQFANSAFLPSLVRTINVAFKASHVSKPELLLHNQGDRLKSSDDFLAGLQDPESFVLIISRPGSDDVIATSSARRYHGPPPERTDDSAPQPRILPWTRTSDVEPGAEEWELKLMATDLSAQGQGLARYMMTLVEEEIIARSKAKQALVEDVSATPPKLKMVLCTARELKGDFYLRRGYTKDYEVRGGEGYNFHVVHLSKTIAT